MLFNRQFIIRTMWMGAVVGLISCVATPDSRNNSTPQSIAGTIDEKAASANINLNNPQQSQTNGESSVNLYRNDDKIHHPHTVTRSCPFAPASMRIHPLTRITTDPFNPDQIQIDLRIELDDRFGDTTKGIGSIRIKLFPRLSENEKGNLETRLALWKPEFQNIDNNAMLFDHITRTYHFLLDVPEGAVVPTQSTLVVTLAIDSIVLTTRRDLHLSAHK